MAKVLLACHQFFPRFYTGTEVLTLETAVELRKRGHDVVILSTEPILPGDVCPERVEYREEIYKEFDVYKLIIPPIHDQMERLDHESDDKRLLPLLKQIIEDIKPDVVHAFHLMRLTYSFVACLKEKNIPVYFTVTDFWLLCPTYQLIRHNGRLCQGPTPNHCMSCLLSAYAKGLNPVPLKFRLGIKYPLLASSVNKPARICRSLLADRPSRTKMLFSMLDGVVWSNPFIQSMFHKNGFYNANEIVIPFPLPEESANLKGLSVNENSDVLKVTFIGTMRASKGPHVLIEAAHLLRDKPIEFHIWGSSDDYKYIEALKSQASSLSNIHFRGTFPQEQFIDVLSETHVVVIPSLWYENTPLTALSVLAAKRALIVSDLGGLSSLVEHNKSGFLFSAGNAPQLAEIINKLSNDKSILLDISSNIKMPHSVDRYVELLTDVRNVQDEE